MSFDEEYSRLERDSSIDSAAIRRIAEDNRRKSFSDIAYINWTDADYRRYISLANRRELENKAPLPIKAVSTIKAMSGDMKSSNTTKDVCRQLTNNSISPICQGLTNKVTSSSSNIIQSPDVSKDVCHHPTNIFHESDKDMSPSDKRSSDAMTTVCQQLTNKGTNIHLPDIGEPEAASFDGATTPAARQMSTYKGATGEILDVDYDDETATMYVRFNGVDKWYPYPVGRMFEYLFYATPVDGIKASCLLYSHLNGQKSIPPNRAAFMKVENRLEIAGTKIACHPVYYRFGYYLVDGRPYCERNYSFIDNDIIVIKVVDRVNMKSTTLDIIDRDIFIRECAGGKVLPHDRFSQPIPVVRAAASPAASQPGATAPYGAARPAGQVPPPPTVQSGKSLATQAINRIVGQPAGCGGLRPAGQAMAIVLASSLQPGDIPFEIWAESHMGELKQFYINSNLRM